MPRVGFELSIQVFEREKLWRTLNSPTTAIGIISYTSEKNNEISNISTQINFDALIYFVGYFTVTRPYRVSQEERSIFYEVTVSVILKKKFIWTCVFFRTVSEIELFECTLAKWLIRKRYYSYVLFLIFIVQMKNVLVYIKFSKIPPSTSMHFATRVITWCVARLSSSWRSFLRAGNSIHYAIEQFVPCIHFSSVHFTLHPTP
jgi:hypothetical protein